jgi:hypothetical protein
MNQGMRMLRSVHPIGMMIWGASHWILGPLAVGPAM